MAGSALFLFRHPNFTTLRRESYESSDAVTVRGCHASLSAPAPAVADQADQADAQESDGGGFGNGCFGDN